MSLTGASLSPAITVREIDLTGVAPNVPSSLTGMVGDFQWGPVEEPVRVSNEGELASKFGTPTASSAVDYMSAAQFLRYSDGLILVRAADSAAANASMDSASSITINNRSDYESQKATLSAGGNGRWIAKYPGALGNSLAVSIFAIEDGDSASSATTLSNWNSWTYKDQFIGIPGTSTWAANTTGTNTNDEIHVAVIDEEGLISGTKGAVLETFGFVSTAVGAKTVDGGRNYVADVINNGSSYLWFGGHDDSASVAGTNWGTAPDGTVKDYATGVSWTNATSVESLGGGANSGVLGTSEYALAFDQFENKDQIDVQILVAPGLDAAADQVTVVSDVVSIAEDIRKDCVVVASPNRNAVVNNANPVASTLTTTNQYPGSSYLVVDNNYLQVFDKYNDQNIYIPAASTVAGLMAATDANYAPWYSPAGERRGLISGASGVSYSPTKAERDDLYRAGVNPIVQFAGRGILLFGDKTKLDRPSAFDRINVRRLFLALEKSISIAARNVMFEFNDEFTRSEFVSVIEPILREVQGRRGITDFRVVCDETNNTPAVVDRNELICTIFIKPARSINFVTLNFVAVRTGVDFEEVVGTV